MGGRFSTATLDGIVAGHQSSKGTYQWAQVFSVKSDGNLLPTSCEGVEIAQAVIGKQVSKRARVSQEV